MPVRNEYGMNEYRIGLASTRYRHENHLNFEYGTKLIRYAGWIDLNTASCKHPNILFHTDCNPRKVWFIQFEFCFDSFIHFEIHFDSLIRKGLISCRHRVDGITNLRKGIISCRIYFVLASCKRGLTWIIITLGLPDVQNLPTS